MREKCYHCGRFISYKNYVVYTPFGSNTDLDPPDERFICLKCYDGEIAQGKEPILMAWIPPIIIRDGKEVDR